MNAEDLMKVQYGIREITPRISGTIPNSSGCIILDDSAALKFIILPDGDVPGGKAKVSKGQADVYFNSF